MNRTVVILSMAGLLVALALIAAPAKKAAEKKARRTAVAAQHARPMRPRLALPGPTAEQGALSFDAQLPGAFAANGDAPTYVAVNISAAQLPHRSEIRQPVNLALVIDHSGSMSGDKLAKAKEAARALIGQLVEGDRLALVQYSTGVDSYPSVAITRESRSALMAWVDRITAEGSTNIGAGLDAGAREVRQYREGFRSSRVILVSDGQATDGVTSKEGLEAKVRALRDGGVTVTALGVGSDFDEVLMRGLAESGAGFYGYIEDASRLEEVFSAELNQASRLVARDVVLTFDPAPGVYLEEALGKTLVDTALGEGTRLYDFSAGLEARTVLRLSVDLDETDEAVELGRLHLSYRDLTTGETVRVVQTLRAAITDDPKLALQNADPEILEHAARAVAAKQMRIAAAQLREGREEEARQTLRFGLDNIRNLFGSSADALAGEMALQDGVGARAGAKALESKSMKSFGENNVY